MNKRKNNKSFAAIWTIVIILAVASIVTYFLLKHPFFNLTNVKLEGNVTYTLEDFKKQSEIYNNNYFLSSTSKAERNIVQDPRIISVNIEKKWPNKLNVSMVEKVNIAYIVDSNGNKVFIDTLGNISENKGSSEKEIPEIVGVNTELLKNTSIFNDKTIKEIYDNLLKYNIDFTKLDFIKKDEMKVIIGETKATLGDKKDIEKKIEIISKVLAENSTKDIKIKEIDVKDVNKPVVIAY